MKKLISVLIALSMALSLAACGSKPAESTAPSAPASSAESTSEAAPAEAGSAVKTGLGIVVNSEVKAEPSADENGKTQADATAAAVMLDAEGRILDAKIDAIKLNAEFSAKGEVLTEATELKSKRQLGNDYKMVEFGNAKAEWFEQADAFAAFVKGKTAEEVSALALNEKGAPTDADLAAACTIDVTDFVAAVTAAAQNAEEMGAAAGDKLGLALVAESSFASADADQNGKIQFELTFALTSADAAGKITANRLNAAQIVYDLGADGAAEAKAVATKYELGSDYKMVEFGKAKAEWFEQADAFSAFVKGKTAEEVSALALNEKGAPTDADLAATCTINVTDFVAAVAQSLA